MTQNEKEKIIKALQDRLAKQPCPRCANQQFTLADGYFNQPFQNELSAGLIIGGPSIPSVVVLCTRCGFVSQHALGMLGLLQPQKVANEKKTDQTNL